MEEKEFLQRVNETFACGNKDLRTYSPLALAYIGDAVYDLMVRTFLVEGANCAVNELHHRASGYVKAASQAKMIDCLLETLSPEEQAVYRRGRNANPHTVAKNASRTDYRKATGFEALVGYLYLSGQNERMFSLVKEGMELAKLK